MIRPNQTRFRLTTIIFVSIITVFFDQISKAAARSLLLIGHPIKFFNGVLVLPLSKNTGAFLGLGSHLSAPFRFILFSLGGAIIIIAIIYYLIISNTLSCKLLIAISFILGGAIGNEIDRLIFHGNVTDFLFLSLGPVHTGVFNLADMAVTFGAIYFLIESKHRPNPPLNSDPA